MSFFERLKGGLSKTKQGFVEKVAELVSGYKKPDESFFEKLEEILIEADVGVNTSLELVDRIRERIHQDKISEMEKVNSVVRDELAKLLDFKETTKTEPGSKPMVVLVVGVNGVGKTTTIGKIAHNYRDSGKDVLLAAADTFRAAAIEQLEVWADRAKVGVVKSQEGADAAAVAYDAVQSALAKQMDVVLIDTAGRLQNKINLMNELAKIKRVISKAKEGAPHEVLLVLDATTGQNAISQAKIFKEVVNVTGVVLTKLDGTAKGGVVFAVKAELGVPVKYIGVGEGIDDLKPFDSQEFVKALFD